MKKLIIVIVLLSVQTLKADAFGITDSKQILQLIKIYNTLVEQLNRLTDVKRNIDNLNELEELRNLSTEDIINGELANKLSKLSNISGSLGFSETSDSIDSQIRNLNDLKKISKSLEEKRAIDMKLSILKRLEALSDASDALKDDMEKAGKNINPREANQISARALTSLTQLAILAEQAAQENKEQQLQSEVDQINFLKGAGKALEKIGKLNKGE